MHKLIEKIKYYSPWLKKNKFQLLIMIIIIIAGIFLRAYKFQEWLHFGSDQSRDAVLVDSFLDQKTSWPLLGADASNTGFKLGPIYHYFQIISAKIFGRNPESLAYPDLFFSIMSIPLFYFLLKRYFNEKLSLALVGLYTFSFYLVEYSRFAWNPNPIPFFAILFLLAWLNFFESKEKTSWFWIISIGISLGVGIQLHTLLIFLFPAIFFLAAVFLIYKNPKTWSKFVVIILVAVLLNLCQIKSETETGGKNSKLFLAAFTDRSGSGASRLSESFLLNILCHAQANASIISPVDDQTTCNFSSIIKHKFSSKKQEVGTLSFVNILFSLIFSALGYALLGYLAWKEKDEKRKNFLILIGLYVILSFFVMLSIIRGAPLRYFIHVSFVPFILLGLLVDRIMKQKRRAYFSLAVALFLLCFIFNIFLLASEAGRLSSGIRGGSGYVVLGEAQKIIAYIIANSGEKNEAYLYGAKEYMSTYYHPLSYLALKEGFQIKKYVPDKELSEAPTFYIWKNDEEGNVDKAGGKAIAEYENFGRTRIYKLKN